MSDSRCPHLGIQRVCLPTDILYIAQAGVAVDGLLDCPLTLTWRVLVDSYELKYIVVK